MPLCYDAAVMITCCDNLALLSATAADSIDLIYIDPPFGTGRRRATTTSGQHYADSARDVHTTIDTLRPRLAAMHQVLKPSGTIYVHLDWRVAHYIKVLMDELFGPDNFLNEVIWHYRTGGSSRRWFGRKHDTILVYAKTCGRHTFNIVRAGAFRTDGLNYDGAGRPYKTTRKGRLYFNPDGPAATDVWDIPFLSTVATERTGYPTQKPERLLERIIAASSNPGDIVADYFCGSGTTLTVARRLGRLALGCDINSAAVDISRRRLAHVECELAEEITPMPPSN